MAFQVRRIKRLWRAVPKKIKRRTTRPESSPARPRATPNDLHNVPEPLANLPPQENPLGQGNPALPVEDVPGTWRGDIRILTEGPGEEFLNIRDSFHNFPEPMENQPIPPLFPPHPRTLPPHSPGAIYARICAACGGWPRGCEVCYPSSLATSSRVETVSDLTMGASEATRGRGRRDMSPDSGPAGPIHPEENRPEGDAGQPQIRSRWIVHFYKLFQMYPPSEDSVDSEDPFHCWMRAWEMEENACLHCLRVTFGSIDRWCHISDLLSCIRGPQRDGLYEPILADSEREAVADLLQYLENRAETDFFSGEPLRALSTLVYSDNVDLQRSASLTFAEITERDVREVDRDTLEPILFLLQNPDIEVQRAASAALGNLAVNTENKVSIVQLGGLAPLIRQMMSPNVEVQCNAVGCITNLATHEDNKAKIARSGALGPLTRLARSKDMRVQRNATGALLNMTHSDENRQQLVIAGAIPVLVQLLSSPDVDVQYYCTTALSNIAVDSANRKKLAQTESRLVQSLVQLMDSSTPKVQCQAALALRNLASDERYQLEIVRSKGLPPLLRLLQSSYLPLILSAVACIRNISIHPQNESPIIDAGFLKPLVDLLGSIDNEEIQCHAISTLRNLAASSDRNKELVLQAGAVQKCKELVLQVPLSVQSEMTAAIAVLALSDELKSHLLKLGVFDVLIPLTASESIEVQGNSAAALGNLSSKVGDYSMFVRDWSDPNGGIHGYLSRFLASGDPTFQHIAIWTLLQLLESEDKRLIGFINGSEDIVQMVKTIADKNVESDDEDNEDGEGEVVALARRSLELLGHGPKQTLVDG
ncbi:vacuolar protein 8 [Polytolypa hystricis UAMH7299]|uniref:Vacuolar protein 8 n=1 Tax=Polytolypa hystricis (strain UAMH7299) TaxID=1447883 RepID=A0A2B7Z239_POLH7|nr:vacuolar protein 8 [Polytolypa hystricis UAMH7299]